MYTLEFHVILVSGEYACMESSYEVPGLSQD